MKKKIMPIMISIFIISVFLIISGCSGESHKDHMKDSEMNETKNSADSSLIRKSGFEVETADANGDNKVYQCPMHYEIIADKYTNCPICKMNLEEFSVDEAQKNFDQH